MLPSLVIALLLTVRPLITDDARTVGRGAAQIETWGRLDRYAVQHWLLLGFGPVESLELTLGGVWGKPDDENISLAGPILQGKWLFLSGVPRGRPAAAVVGGASAPWGSGAFRGASWDGFGYLAITQEAREQERLLFHANIGAFLAGADQALKATWGLGAQTHLFAGLNAMAEVFSADPYAASAGGAFQAGLRYVFNTAVQIDTAIGRGLWGDPRLPLWATMGLRLVRAP